MLEKLYSSNLIKLKSLQQTFAALHQPQQHRACASVSRRTAATPRLEHRHPADGAQTRERRTRPEDADNAGTPGGWCQRGYANEESSTAATDR